LPAEPSCTASHPSFFLRTRLIFQPRDATQFTWPALEIYGCMARLIAASHSRVAVIGAGSRGEFRVEDQMCCAWIARDLAEMGYAPANQITLDLIKQWATLPPEAAASGKSADYLRRSGQIKDLEFVLSHINDLREAYVMQGGKVVVSPSDEIDSFLLAIPSGIRSLGRAPHEKPT